MSPEEINQALEDLKGARSMIEDPTREYKFSQWNTCTVGFIYLAAGGNPALASEGRVSPYSMAHDPRFAEAVVDGAKALGYDAERDLSGAAGAAQFISDRVSSLMSDEYVAFARDNPDAGWTQSVREALDREAAVKTLTKAIDTIEGGYKEALAQR